MTQHAIHLGHEIDTPTFGFQATPGGRDGAIVDDSDAGLVTIAGTGTGKGISQVIPTALTYPGSMIILDIKGEISAVTARARREMGQEVIILDPFSAETDALNPMEAIDIATMDAPDQCKRLARMMIPKQVGDRDPFWDDMAEQVLSSTLLFLVSHVARAECNLGLLHRMWGVADHLDEMLAAMSMAVGYEGAIISGAKAYLDAPDKTAGSIMTSLRTHIDFLSSPRARASLRGGSNLLAKVRDSHPMTIYLRVPPHMLASHGRLLRIWLGSILTAVTERHSRPEIPDLFLVDEAATLGHLNELLTAASLLRGYGLRTWTFWQSIGQIEQIYGSRAAEFIDNAGMVSMFGAGNAAAASRLGALTGFRGEILGMPRDEQVLCRQGHMPMRARKLDYRTDPRCRGRFDANPLHARPAVRKGEAH